MIQDVNPETRRHSARPHPTSCVARMVSLGFLAWELDRGARSVIQALGLGRSCCSVEPRLLNGASPRPPPNKPLKLTAERVGETIRGGGQGSPGWVAHGKLHVGRSLAARRWAAARDSSTRNGASILGECRSSSRSIAPSSRESNDGTTVFFPWGLTHRGYQLTGDTAKKKASRAASFLVGSPIAIGVWTAHALMPIVESEGNGLTEILGVLVAPGIALILVLVSLLLWVSRFVERFPESDLKFSREERLREAAKLVRGVGKVALRSESSWLRPLSAFLHLAPAAGMVAWLPRLGSRDWRAGLEFPSQTCRS